MLLRGVNRLILVFIASLLFLAGRGLGLTSSAHCRRLVSGQAEHRELILVSVAEQFLNNLIRVHLLDEFQKSSTNEVVASFHAVQAGLHQVHDERHRNVY